MVVHIQLGTWAAAHISTQLYILKNVGVISDDFQNTFTKTPTVSLEWLVLVSTFQLEGASKPGNSCGLAGRYWKWDSIQTPRSSVTLIVIGGATEDQIVI